MLNDIVSAVEGPVLGPDDFIRAWCLGWMHVLLWTNWMPFKTTHRDVGLVVEKQGKKQYWQNAELSHLFAISYSWYKNKDVCIEK